ncbi:DNA-processing protein DprA [Conyzicola nivalis]|uniref:DNA processing protein DprA n=1 Tax=Conyzicola nivalis TaxID=1477021 RepID=A0A916SHW5_9MICO|nr:DNA-processing protein DprA [Conyzicola nivalis]GGB01012.1 DNA processing protein DprA [Conyzicola nivalis]
MTMFGLGETEIEPLVTALAGRDLSRDDQRQLFARAAWSGIAEPGDRLAGALITSAGAAESLRALLASASVESMRALLPGGEVDDDQLVQALERWRPRLDPSAAVNSMRQAARVDARLLVPGDPLWPVGVDDLGGHAPLALWVRGTDAALAALPRSIALVGARAATGYGEHVTMEAAAGLVDRGYAIVSGAAYGIDGMAHRAALASHGQTVAFLAGGVDRFYPSGHDALLTRIVDEGAVISELPCGQPPTKWRFLQRNRLIAAASRATVVMEAGWRSGSLNTAAHASTLGRPLGAVPGPVTSAASAGCHRLIRDFTAVCVTNPDEMAELAPLDRSPALFGPGELDDRSPDRTRLFDALSVRSPRHVADIAARAGLSLDAVRSLLGALELEGEVAERERGWVRVARDADRR